MLRVGFITYAFDGYGGTQLYANIITQKLESIGLNVRHIELNTLLRDAPKLRFPLSYFPTPKLLENLEKLLRGIDVIHLNNLVPNIVPSLLPFIKKRMKVPIIFTVHETIYSCPLASLICPSSSNLCNSLSFFSKCSKCIYSDVYKQHNDLIERILSYSKKVLRDFSAEYFYRVFLRNANIVISPSKSFASLLRRVGVQAIHMYNPLPLLNTGEQDIIEKDAPLKRPYICFVAKLNEEKGAFLLSRIALFLRNRVSIVVIGEGPLSNVIKGSNIVYLGSVGDEVKYEILRHSEALIYPSIVFEPGPMAILESLAFGVPVVVFDIGGQSEIIRKSGGGLLANPFDVEVFVNKIIYLLEDSTKTRELGRKGRIWIEQNCNPDDYVRRLVRLYKELI